VRRRDDCQEEERAGGRASRPAPLTRRPLASYHGAGGEALRLAQRESRKEVPVVDLGRARDARRLQEYQLRSRQVLDANKRALARLFQSGQIYSRVGARLARDLLLAHQHLLKVSDLLARLGETAATERAEAEAVYGEVQALLSRTAALTARSDGILARR
jgi:hypothetical protein